MEKRVDELRRQCEEARQFCLHRCIPIVIVVRRHFKVLLELVGCLAQSIGAVRSAPTDLEQVLLVAKRLLPLLSQLRQRVIETIIVDELVVALGDTLPDLLEDGLELLDGANNARLDELQLWRESALEFVQREVIPVHVPDCVTGVRVLAYQVKLACDRLEHLCKVLREVDART